MTAERLAWNVEEQVAILTYHLPHVGEVKVEVELARLDDTKVPKAKEAFAITQAQYLIRNLANELSRKAL